MTLFFLIYKQHFTKEIKLCQQEKWKADILMKVNFILNHFSCSALWKNLHMKFSLLLNTIEPNQVLNFAKEKKLWALTKKDVS